MELRASRIREMSRQEREETLKNLRESLLRERASHAMGGAPSNPGKIKSIKRQIARVLTVMTEENKE
ncbi:50S ribosomal protein L29 [Thermogymnomonas acidicola]|uniref:Large ribosomal subunit protein uL29 n=1 Tax=Thermogymnomonas acidicola TaxID=399579 RepID=A0AA37F989_9ARCH|nr:50S ribosomal protein L29 [Thermogymnomonas acidicola]GGM71999.1 50S ribosomal protein L29 [Thermogymnomonas acidicola]